MTCLCCQYELALDQADGSRENLSAVNVIVEHIETGTSGREQNDISVLCQQKAYLYRLIHGGYPVYRYIAGLDGLCNFVCIPSQQYDTAHMLADWLFQRGKILSFAISTCNQNHVFCETRSVRQQLNLCWCF